jgi:cytosine/adenosine deaminase-related metal-dependent hydrolase
VVDNIGLLVTNDPELGEVRDAALVIEDGVVAAVERVGAHRRRWPLRDPRVRG